MSVCGRAPSRSTATNRSRWPCTSTARVTRAKSAMRKGCPPAWSIPLWAHVLRACVSDQQSVRVEDRFARPVSPTAVRVRIGRLIARIGDHAGRRHRNIGAGERVRRRCAWRRRRARWRRAEIERRRAATKRCRESGCQRNRPQKPASAQTEAPARGRRPSPACQEKSSSPSPVGCCCSANTINATAQIESNYEEHERRPPIR